MLYVALSEWKQLPNAVLEGMTEEQLLLMMEQRDVDMEDRQLLAQGKPATARARRRAKTHSPMKVLRRRPRGLKE